MRAFRYGSMITILTASMSVLAVLLGCAAPVQTAATHQTPAAPPAAVEHVVRRGETLSAIAARYTGEANNWPMIARENPGINPDRIAPGDVLLIPAGMVRHDRQAPASTRPAGLVSRQQPHAGALPESAAPAGQTLASPAAPGSQPAPEAAAQAAHAPGQPASGAAPADSGPDYFGPRTAPAAYP